jgi:hypothetical protein
MPPLFCIRDTLTDLLCQDSRWRIRCLSSRGHPDAIDTGRMVASIISDPAIIARRERKQKEYAEQARQLGVPVC